HDNSLESVTNITYATNCFPQLLYLDNSWCHHGLVTIVHAVTAAQKTMANFSSFEPDLILCGMKSSLAWSSIVPLPMCSLQKASEYYYTKMIGKQVISSYDKKFGYNHTDQSMRTLDLIPNNNTKENFSCWRVHAQLYSPTH
ncbi:hypothetical protein J0S82_000520, partial [Galemys pyrenaicus]